MKNKLLILSVFTLFCGFASAQNESALADEMTVLVNAPDFSVVRNWQNTFTISSHGKYLVKDTLGMTSATTGTVSFFSALITDTISNLSISDMKFVDNYAFICGSIRVSSTPGTVIRRGVLGYFDVNEFYAYNMLSIKLHVYEDVKGFSKLVAYNDITDYKVVAIGDYKLSVSGGLLYPSCIVEDLVMNPIATNYFKWVTYDTTSLYPREYLTDLLLVDNQVVFVGYLYRMGVLPYPYNTLSIRVADKHDVTGTISNRNLYDTGVDEIVGNVRATYLQDNHFALSYLYHDGITGDFFTRIRTIDANSMKMVCSQEFQTYDKDEPIEMAYDSLNNILTILHPMPFFSLVSYSQSYFVQINPFTTYSYNASVLISKEVLLSSIDMFSDEYYVSTGGNHWYYQHTIAPQPNFNGCPDHKEIIVKPLPNPDRTNDPNTPLGVYSVVTMDTRSALVNTTTIDLQCDDN